MNWGSGVCDFRAIEAKPLYSGILLLAAFPYVVIFFLGRVPSWKVAMIVVERKNWQIEGPRFV